ALAHIDTNEVRIIYNRTRYKEQRRDMMEWWMDHVEAASYGRTCTGSVAALKINIIQGNK
ncbi:TPA: hypothetical protein G9F27_005524, partial [Salmonella enterica]|nr:hypothetical protein [Salmonella enterica]